MGGPTWKNTNKVLPPGPPAYNVTRLPAKTVSSKNHEPEHYTMGYSRESRPEIYQLRREKDHYGEQYWHETPKEKIAGTKVHETLPSFSMPGTHAGRKHQQQQRNHSKMDNRNWFSPNTNGIGGVERESFPAPVAYMPSGPEPEKYYTYGSKEENVTKERIPRYPTTSKQPRFQKDYNAPNHIGIIPNKKDRSGERPGPEKHQEDHTGTESHHDRFGTRTMGGNSKAVNNKTHGSKGFMSSSARNTDSWGVKLTC